MALKQIVGDTQVAVTTAGEQHSGAVAALGNGVHMVVWEGPDASNNGIFGRLFRADFLPLAGEFQINMTTFSSQSVPAAVGHANAPFLVVWSSFALGAGRTDVIGRLYDAVGIPLSAEFLINATAADDQLFPVPVALPGGFVVVWVSEGQDGSGDGVFARRFNVDGTPVGGEFQVNAFATGDQRDPEAAALADGGFVIVWNSTNQSGPATQTDVFARRYSADGSPDGGEFQVNTTTEANQHLASVAALADGRFVIAWDAFGQDGNGRGVAARLFNADGTAAGDEFLVNTFTPGTQGVPRVEPLPDGGFVVAWSSADQDGGGFGLFAQAFNADGSRDGAEIRINSATVGNQILTDTAVFGGNAVGFVWQGTNQAGALTGNDTYMAVFGDSPPVWRFYNNANGVHFFTVSTAERDAVIATLPSFRFEGSGFAAAPHAFAETAAVWRFYNTANGAHFYTISETERNAVINMLPTFQFEGSNYVAYATQAVGTIPLYRFYNDLTGAHFFTASEAERDFVIDTLPVFRFEGVAYYVDPVNG